MSWAASSELPFFGAARSAALKIQGALADSMRRDVQNRSPAASIFASIRSIGLAGSEYVYSQLIESMAQQRVAAIKYRSLTEWEEIETKLRPYQLLFNRHTWYVIGRSSLHGGPRTFNLGRIAEHRTTNQQKYARPRGFSVERYLGNAWNIMPQPGPDENVVIRFAPLVAKNVAEVTWHKTQRARVSRRRLARLPCRASRG